MESTIYYYVLEWSLLYTTLYSNGVYCILLCTRMDSTVYYYVLEWSLLYTTIYSNGVYYKNIVFSLQGMLQCMNEKNK